MLRRFQIVVLIFLVLLAGLGTLVWTGKVGSPAIVTVPKGREKAPDGSLRFRVGVTNHSPASASIIVARYQVFRFRSGELSTNCMAMTNFILSRHAGLEVAVDAPHQTNCSTVIVQSRRERGAAEIRLRALAARLRLCRVYGPWTELARYPLGND